MLKSKGVVWKYQTECFVWCLCKECENLKPNFSQKSLKLKNNDLIFIPRSHTTLRHRRYPHQSICSNSEEGIRNGGLRPAASGSCWLILHRKCLKRKQCCYLGYLVDSMRHNERGKYIISLVTPASGFVLRSDKTVPRRPPSPQLCQPLLIWQCHNCSL